MRFADLEFELELSASYVAEEPPEPEKVVAEEVPSSVEKSREGGPPVSIIQDDVTAVINKRASSDDPAPWYVLAETGVGKTVGIANKIKADVDLDRKYLVAVFTRADADAFARLLCDTLVYPVEQVGLWTKAHDTVSPVLDEHIAEPFMRTTKEEAHGKRVVIVTQASLSESHGPWWLEGRDVVLIDEKPATFHETTNLSCSDFNKLFEGSSIDTTPDGKTFFRKMSKWADEQKAMLERYKLVEAIPDTELPVFDFEVSEEALKPSSELANRAITFYRDTAAVNGFLYRKTATDLRFVSYSFDIPDLSKAIIFSATADLGVRISGDGFASSKLISPEVDLNYRNLNVQFLPWPLQVRSGKPGLPIPYYYNKIVRDRNHRNDFIDHVFNRLEADKALGPKSLVVCPMVIHSDMDERLSMYGVKTIYWGRDVGTNAYRDCEYVMLAGLHHKPDSAIIAEYLAYSGTGATPEALEPFDHWNRSTLKSAKFDSHCDSVKQMAARGNLRQLSTDVDGKVSAGKMTLVIMHTHFDYFKRIADRLYGKHGGRVAPTDKVFRYPKAADAVLRFLETKKLSEFVILLKDVRAQIPGIRDQIHLFKEGGSAEARLHELGWDFIPGKKGRGAAAKFMRRP